MRIGIFGGSFNPVHEGHVRLAEHAVSELNLEKFFFVPSYETPLKQKDSLLPTKERLLALREVIKKNPNFSLSLCEIRRKGVSYTVDTLRYFEKKYGKKNTFYFITGADTLKSLHKWKSLEVVLNKCRFVVATRPGFAVKNLPDRVLYMPFEAVDISSTQIRNRRTQSNTIPK